MTDHIQYYCRVCSQTDGDMLQVLALAQEYAASLPPEQCVPEEAYRRRLAQCGLCRSLRDHTCALCGCLVLVRAKKNSMDCPDPGGSRWERSAL